MKGKYTIVLFLILSCFFAMGSPYAPSPLIGIIATKTEADAIAKGNTPIKIADLQHSIKIAGGVPITLSPLMDKQDLNDKFATINGLIIPGGADIDPTLYGEAPDLSIRSFIEGTNKDFDLFEIDLLQKAIQKK